MIAYIYRVVCLGDSGHKIIQEAILVLKNFQGRPAHGASNSAVGVFTGLHYLVSAHFQTNQEIKKAPTKKRRLHQKHFFVRVSVACRDQGCRPSEKFSELDGLVFLFPIILVPLSWNGHNCNISMSCGISSFSSSRMRVGSHSVRFPPPSWRFQRGSHQLQMPCCFSSAWWLFSPHKDLEGF